MEKTRNSANVDPRTRRLAFCALFTALGVVLGGLLRRCRWAVIR